MDTESEKKLCEANIKKIEAEVRQIDAMTRRTDAQTEAIKTDDAMAQLKLNRARGQLP